MNRTKIFLAALTAAVVLPAAASANCGTMQGSFAVTCEQGVQVYRHQSLSSIPQGISQQSAQLQAEEIRAKTERARINAQSRNAAANRRLREREIAIDDFNARTDNQFLRRSNNFGNNGFGNSNRLFGDNGIRGFHSSYRPRSAFRAKTSRDR